ncbi:MAG: hypothetical protein K6T28_00575 [Acidothermus sp.]|nr:hypothetical protein [Acidothermus sp.]
MPVLLVLAAVVIALFVVLPLVGMALWALISAAIVGLIVGGLGRLVIPGRQQLSLWATMLLGWIGSVVGGFIADRLLHVGAILTLLVQIAIAALLIWFFAGTRSRSGLGSRTARW